MGKGPSHSKPHVALCAVVCICFVYRSRAGSSRFCIGTLSWQPKEGQVPPSSLVSSLVTTSSVTAQNGIVVGSISPSSHRKTVASPRTSVPSICLHRDGGSMIPALPQLIQGIEINGKGIMSHRDLPKFVTRDLSQGHPVFSSPITSGIARLIGLPLRIFRQPPRLHRELGHPSIGPGS